MQHSTSMSGAGTATAGGGGGSAASNRPSVSMGGSGGGGGGGGGGGLGMGGGAAGGGLGGQGSPRRQNYDDVITCGICFQILQEPCTIDCGHSYCTRCVKTRLDRSGIGGGMICLICNSNCQHISIRTLEDYANPQLQTRIATLNRGAEGRPMCQWCDETPATLHCQDCMYVLCSDCNVAVHKNSAKRGHQPTVLQDGKNMKSMSKKCVIRGHEEYRQEFYCLKCESLCCAYCLQLGPHRNHESELVSQAAAQVRQQMGRDLESLAQHKAKIEGMANELNRVQGQYLDSYDTVETLIAERFAAFKQQLAQKEVEVRKILHGLRDSGDRSLAESRVQFLKKLNNINEAGLSFRRLQHGGADYEVLQNRERMGQFLKIDVPQVSGTGFKLSDMGDLNLAGLTIGIDLNSINSELSMAGRQGQGNQSGRTNSSAATGAQGAEPPMQQRSRIRFTWVSDPDVEFRETNDGLYMRCSDKPENEQTGIRANESFESFRQLGQQEGNVITWRIRLDLVNDSFVGVIDSTEDEDPEGFYWKPMKQGWFDGKVGRVQPTLRNLPVTRNGDILRLSYDLSGKVLKLAINNMDRGIICTDLHSQLTPCIIFRPGECMTILY